MKSYALIVDDDPDACAIVSMVLARAGWRTRTAANGLEALGEIQRHPPQLIITDIMMPVMDGIEFIGRLKADPALGAIPVIVSSALSATELQHLGGDAVVGKGSSLVRELTEVIQAMAIPGMPLGLRGG